MPTKAFILIEVQVGRANQVAGSLRLLPEVSSAEVVTGTFDIIASIEVSNMAAMADLVTSQDAFTLGRANSLFNRGHKATIDVVADQRMTKLDSAVAGQRFDAQPDFGKLAGASRLLFVPVFRFRLAADRFAIRDAGLLQANVNVVAALESFGNGLEVDLSLAG